MIILMIISISSLTIQAQQKGIITDTITIKGNCGQCKERIEEAAHIKGVKTAEWNKTTKMLTVVFNTNKTTIDKITESISKVGHDSKNFTASDKNYKKLPSCCAYRTGVCEHD